MNKPSDRPFKSSLSIDQLEAIQSGVMRSKYRGVTFWKDPLSIGIYLNLISRLSPGTIVEVGSKFGGSALFFADMLSCHGCGEQVISIDIDPPTNIRDPRITFIKGNALALELCLPKALLDDLRRPLLVIEDSAHKFETTLAVLKFFDPVMKSGEYMVVEDGIVSQMRGSQYAAYEDGPNRAVATFLQSNSKSWDIDESLCDLYGYNMSYNPNGWLRKR